MVDNQCTKQMKTLYDLLGIGADASMAQIELGYKRALDRYLAHHRPGRLDKETRRIQTAREAYLLLCSPQRRLAYDQQLRLYEMARTHISNRSNLTRAALLMVVALALGVGVYLHKTQQVYPQTTEPSERSREPARVSGLLRHNDQASLTARAGAGQAH
jgi:curved DNA-binding protein CbpA